MSFHLLLRAKAAVFALLALFLVTACSPPPAATNDSAPTASGKTDPNATMRFVFAYAPGTLDPQLANSAFYNVPLFLVFDRLVHVAPDGSPVGGLAESWEFAPDGSSLTLNLREGVTFQDGTPVDAEAVKLNIERGKTLEGSFVATDLAAVHDVEVVDEHTAVLNLSEPDAGLVLKLSDRAGAMVSPTSLKSKNTDVHPIGAGMYQLASDYEVGVKMSLERFDGYWDKEAQKLAGVDVTFMTDTAAALNSVKSGGADVAYVLETEIDPAKSANLQVVEAHDLGFGNILMNPDKTPALRDERVRLAINLAIDRQEIVDGVLFGHGAVASQPFPPGYFAHADDAGQFPFDPDHAKELLAEAGYPDGFDWEIHNVPGGSTRINEAIAGQLAKVGINVTVRQTEGAAATEGYSVSKSIEALNVRWSGRPDPSATLALIFMPGGINNPSGRASDEVKRLFALQAQETDAEKRAEILQDISRELVAHPPASNIVLYQSVTATVAIKDVVGLQEWMTGKVEFRGVGIAG